MWINIILFSRISTHFNSIFCIRGTTFHVCARKYSKGYGTLLKSYAYTTCWCIWLSTFMVGIMFQIARRIIIFLEKLNEKWSRGNQFKAMKLTVWVYEWESTRKKYILTDQFEFSFCQGAEPFFSLFQRERNLYLQKKTVTLIRHDHAFLVKYWVINLRQCRPFIISACVSIKINMESVNYKLHEISYEGEKSIVHSIV